MATFRNRHGKWQGRVQRKGQKPISKSFHTKQDAERWARSLETDIDKGAYTNTNLAERTPFKDVIFRYLDEVLPTLRHHNVNQYRLKALASHWIAQLSMSALTPTQVGKYRDERLKIVSNGAVIRELAFISSIINQARREWGINMTNPVPLVKKPSTPAGRNRILNEAELNRLLEACKPRVKNGNIWVYPLVQFALATAMRRGEILGLRWSDINFEKRTAFIPMTKNGMPRTVPFSSKAIELLQQLPRSMSGYVYPIEGPTLSASFHRARTKAKLEDFHFHDIRHMAITRMAEKLPNLIELSAVSGHKSLAMLKRYYHPNPEQLAEKLG